MAEYLSKDVLGIEGDKTAAIALANPLGTVDRPSGLCSWLQNWHFLRTDQASVVLPNSFSAVPSPLSDLTP